MNLLDNKQRNREVAFVNKYASKYTSLKNTIDESVRFLFDILDDSQSGTGNRLNFSSAETLEESINDVLSAKGLSGDYTFYLADKIKKNYSLFFKTIFRDFNLKIYGYGPRYSHGEDNMSEIRNEDCTLSLAHLTLVAKAEYFNDSYDRYGGMAKYIDYRLGLYGNLTVTDKLNIDRFMFGENSNIRFKYSLWDSLYVSLIRMNMGLINPNSSKPEALCLLNVDIQSDIIKEIKEEELMNPLVKSELMSCIINKFFMSIYTNISYYSSVLQYDVFKNILLTNTDSITYFDVYMSLIINKLSSNTVNNKLDYGVNPDMSMEMVISSIKNQFAMLGPSNFITEGIHDLRRFLTLRYYNDPVFLDDIIDRFVEKFRDNCNKVKFELDGCKTALTGSIIPKRFSLESLDNCNMRSNPLLVRDKDKACISLMGMESISMDEYNKYKATTRIKLLGKLSPRERKLFLKTESNVTKVKADVINCETPIMQKLILKQLDIIGKDISSYIENSGRSQEFRELMNLCELDRSELAQILSNRNFLKERNTMLYGQLKTSNEWNY
ncbi:MAG: hypothetical protein ACRC92_14765 [Peptostreptococcaceae bacterium]